MIHDSVDWTKYRTDSTGIPPFVHGISAIYLIDSAFLVFTEPHLARCHYLHGETRHKQGREDSWGDQATFDCPSGIAIDDFQNIFIADRSNHCIRVILAENGAQFSYFLFSPFALLVLCPTGLLAHSRANSL